VPGRFTGRANSTACALCPAGKYADGVRLTSCNACTGGQFAAAPAAVYCETCGPGRYAAVTEATTALQEAAEAGSGVGSAACLGCPAGMHFGTKGAASVASCQACAKGKHAPVAGAEECVECPTGTYQENEGAAVCTACEVGQYQPKTAVWKREDCADCVIGTVDTDADPSTACLQCEPGQSTRSKRGPQCLCIAGWFGVRLADGTLTCRQVGLGRIVALHYRSSTSCQIR
jgi:hypothetical protein